MPSLIFSKKDSEFSQIAMLIGMISLMRSIIHVQSGFKIAIFGEAIIAKSLEVLGKPRAAFACLGIPGIPEQEVKVGSTASVAGETAGTGAVRHEIEDHPAEPFPSMDGNAGIGYL